MAHVSTSEHYADVPSSTTSNVSSVGHICSPPPHTHTRAHARMCARTLSLSVRLVCILGNKEFSNPSPEQSHKLSACHTAATANGFSAKLNSYYTV